MLKQLLDILTVQEYDQQRVQSLLTALLQGAAVVILPPVGSGRSELGQQIPGAAVEFHEIEIDNFGAVPGIIDTFMEKLEALGPNPFKE